MNVLIIQKLSTDFSKKNVAELQELFQKDNIKPIVTESFDEAYQIIESNKSICCLLLSLFIRPDFVKDKHSAEEVVTKLYERQPNVPVFLLNENYEFAGASTNILKYVNEMLLISQDTPDFIYGRIRTAIQNYQNNLLPQFVADMKKFVETNEFSWTIPGHQGYGLRKTPGARQCLNFVGENVFKLDLNSSRNQLGSLLGHKGSFLKSERQIAKIFGSDLSYTGVVGGSGSNRTVMQFCLKAGDKAIIDRNCHKSVAHGIVLTGIQPEFLIPTRNKYGIIGPIDVSKLAGYTNQKDYQYFVLTNCTFDGICYNSKIIESKLPNLKYQHFDEAWFAHARFHPLYENLYALRGDSDNYNADPTIFVTHSTHKMLNALGQGSFIHIRYGKNIVDPEMFNQYYMMHTTTSPSYVIAASNDIAADMMKGDTGKSLVGESIIEAINFRKTLMRKYLELKQQGTWFFKTWNIEKYGDKNFHEIDTEELANNQKYWMLNKNDEWHGFEKEYITDGVCMLDPIKVSILTPTDKDVSIPASLVCMYLAEKGITICRSSDFQIMILFTLGVTKGKWFTMIKYLEAFKKLYDNNEKVSSVFPTSLTGEQYENIGLKDLSNKMNAFLQINDLSGLLNKAYKQLPEVAMNPKKAFENTTSNSKFVKLADAKSEISTTFLIPYPPGIPIIISGERFGKDDCPILNYLTALQQWDKEFPGFEKETTGVKVEDGVYYVSVVNEKPQTQP